MNKEQLISFKVETEALYNGFKAQCLSLNMARGNPCKEQLRSLPLPRTAQRSSLTSASPRLSQLPSSAHRLSLRTAELG